jgi:hypothetical protein
MSALSSVQLIVIGVLGEYVGRIYEQVKARPLYVVGERLRHRKARKRAETQDFGSLGEVVAPVPSAPPPPLPAKASGSMRPAASASNLSSRPPPPLPSAAKNRDKP